MRKLEVMEEVMKLGRRRYHLGDISSFEDDVAQQLIDLGWCKDCETGEQGERSLKPVTLTVDSVVQKIAAL